MEGEREMRKGEEEEKEMRKRRGWRVISKLFNLPIVVRVCMYVCMHLTHNWFIVLYLTGVSRNIFKVCSEC